MIDLLSYPALRVHNLDMVFSDNAFKMDFKSVCPFAPYGKKSKKY